MKSSDDRPEAEPEFRPAPDWKHPLMGASLGTLTGALVRYGGVSWRCLPLTASLLLSAAVRSPFDLMERIATAGTRRGRTEAPLFIVGFWRSGTTHLHNLLARSPAFGIITPLASGLPGELLTLGTWLRPWLERSLPETRGLDAVAVTPESPQEDEIPLANRQLLSVYHALYFPGKFQARCRRGIFFEGATEAQQARWERQLVRFVAKVVRHQGQARILIKNPVYTARVRRLRAIWPEARFVHIYRNPYDTFVSALHYYRSMLARLALQRPERLDLERWVLNLYPSMLDRWYADAARLAPESCYEICFEDLTARPLPVLERLHEELQLPGWAQAKSRIENYLATIAGYRQNRYRLSETQRVLVARHWREYLEKWGYGAPAE